MPPDFGNVKGCPSAFAPFARLGFIYGRDPLVALALIVALVRFFFSLKFVFSHSVRRGCCRCRCGVDFSSSVAVGTVGSHVSASAQTHDTIHETQRAHTWTRAHALTRLAIASPPPQKKNSVISCSA